MKYVQLLEKIDFEFPSPYDSSQTVKVHKNPNCLEALQARNKSSFNELRGLVVNDAVVYIWDANLATHDDVLGHLDVSTTVSRFIIDAEGLLMVADTTTPLEHLSALPMIKRMMTSPNPH
jgi:hypothetical protein